MSNESKFSKVVWAVDPFGEDEIQRQAVLALHALVIPSAPAIIPVSVLTPEQLDVLPKFYPDWERHYLPYAERAIRALVSASELNGVAEPVVLVEYHGSVRKAVDRLVEFAVSKNADLIAVSTHARKGFDRFYLGSFSETIFLRSPVPVYITGPSAKVGRRITKVLFATDFSEPAHKAFETVLQIARKTEAAVTIFSKTVMHKLAIAQVPTGLVLPDDIGSMIENEIADKKRMAATWADEARQRGISATTVVDTGVEAVASSILRHAENGGYSLIAMLAETGPVASVITGSTTRSVVRSAPCSVLVLRQS